MTLVERATDLLTALATSDVERVSAMTAPNAIVYGTDVGERWHRRDDLVRALGVLRSLQLQAIWAAPPTAGIDWVVGVAMYTSPSMQLTPVRVTMVFHDELLVHAHFSVEVPAVSPS
jgi:hypothetical protein